MTFAWTAIDGALRRWVLPVALLVIAGASGWMLQNLDDATSGAADRPPDAPDAFMDDFVTVETDGAGRPVRRLAAERIVYHADQTVTLTNPYYVLYRADGEPWHVRSDHGHLSADGSVLSLTGNVDIWRNDEFGARDLDIRTEDLKVLPETEYGETANPVTITMPSSTSRGVGMRAWLDETRIELLSEVTTHVDRLHRTR